MGGSDPMAVGERLGHPLPVFEPYHPLSIGSDLVRLLGPSGCSLVSPELKGQVWASL